MSNPNPNRLSVGTVTTGTPGTSAAASLTGSIPLQVVNFTIPQGTPGDITTVYQLGNVSGAMDFSTYTVGGVFHLTLIGNITGITLPAQGSTQRTFELILNQDATGSRTITWPAHKSSDGLDPVLSTAAAAIDRVVMVQNGVFVELIQTARALS